MFTGSTFPQARSAWSSVGEAEMHHIAVGDDIFFAFKAHLASILGALFTAEAYVIIIGNRLGTDEALFEIRVDDTGSGRCAGAARDGPGAGFFRPHREIGDEVEKRVTGADETGEAWFAKAQSFEILVAIIGGKLRDFFLDAG